MRRLIRPALFTLVSVAAIDGFVAAGQFSAQRLDWSNFGGWLSRTDPPDALGELARWIGLGLAVYVAIVSIVALLAELAGAVRLPRLHFGLRRLASVVALPALRRRLLEMTTVATITVSSLHSLPGGAAIAPMTSALVVDSVTTTSPVVVGGEFEGFGVIPTRADVPTNDPAGTHTIVRGDTLWRIITDHYGRCDQELLDRVVAANPVIVDPSNVAIGQNIVLPDPETYADPVPERAPVAGEATWAVTTVKHGDTLWDIVDRHYGHATAELVWAVVDANPRLDNPNLIHTGQQITLPPMPGRQPGPHVETQPEVQPQGQPLPPPAVTDVPVDPQPAPPVATTSPATALPPAATEPPDVPVPAVADPVPASGPLISSSVAPVGSSVAGPRDSSIGTAGTVPVANDPSTSPANTASLPHVVVPGVVEADDGFSPSMAEVMGWTGGAGLAAALLAIAKRRRRRQPIGERLRRPSKRAVQLGVALRETENLSTVDWAAMALRMAAARLRPRPGESTPVPRLLRLDGDQIELLWDTPNTEPTAPWQTPDGGWSWTLDRTEESVDTDIPSPCPCLVTIGRHGGADVLLNLESCGAIAVSGDDDSVRAIVRSIATELAASVFADASTVLIVGGEDLPGRPDHARIVDVPEAVGWLRDRTDSAGALLAHRRLTSLFALRARSRPQDGHEPVIVVVIADGVSDEDIATIVNLANGDLGAIVVLAGASDVITWSLQCAGDTVRVEPLGLSLDRVGFEQDLDDAIEEIIPAPDPLDDDFTGEADQEPELVLADHLDMIQMRQMAELCVEEVEDEQATQAGEWDVELKVLGQVRCVGTKEPLTPTELHLAIYLAFHRNGENSDTIATMIWPNGAASRTVTNAMAGLRRKLGTGSDGEMLFPLGRDNQYVYRLSKRVTTDWERFVALAKQAEKLPPDEAVVLLDEALDLIDGPPFRAAAGYSWAYSDGTATLMTETVLAAANKAIEIHHENAETLAARRTEGIASRVSDSEDDDSLPAKHFARKDGMLRHG